MIILFNTTMPVKKEASFLKKLLKKHIRNKKVLLSDIHDIVSRMYGWENYNRLSQAHSPETSFFSGINTGNEKSLIKSINALSIQERSSLEIQKKTNLLGSILEITSNNANDVQIAHEIVNDFFIRKSQLSDIFMSRKAVSGVKKINGTLALSADAWRGHTVFNSNSIQDVVDFVLSDVLLAQAILSGGTFVLRESVANKVFSVLNDILIEKNRLKVFYSGTKDDFKNLHKSSYAFDPFEPKSVDKSIVQNLGCCFNDKNSNPLNTRAAWLMSVLYDVDYNVKTLINNMTIESFYKKVCEASANGTFKKSVEAQIKVVSPEIQKRFFVDKNYSYFSNEETLQLAPIIALAKKNLEEIVSFPNSNGSINMADCFHGDSINIFVVSDKCNESNLNLDAMITMCIRTMIAPALGTAVEGRKSIIKSERKVNYKPVFFDSSLNTHKLKGLSVVAAQMRAIGYAVFYAMNNFTLREEGRESSEAKMRLINSNIKIYSGPWLVQQFRNDMESVFHTHHEDNEYSAKKMKEHDDEKNKAVQHLLEGKVVMTYRSSVHCGELNSLSRQFTIC